MKIWELSVRRPIFMSSILVSLLVLGGFAFSKIPVELFPDISFPIVTVQTIYPGAAPNEIESLVSKPLEEELSGIAGIKNIRSVNRESLSYVIAEFTFDTDIKYAEQQVRDKVSSSKKKLPSEIEEPIIRKIDPSAQPIMQMALVTPLKRGELYDLANEFIKSKIEQVNQVGRVDLLGVQKREIQIQIDRNKLEQRQLSLMQVIGGLKNAGQNVPAGKVDQAQSEMVYRTIGEFNSLDQIKNTSISFYGNDSMTKISDIGKVIDTVEEEKVKAYLNGQETALLFIYKQSGANSIKVSDQLRAQVEKINAELKQRYGDGTHLEVVADSAKFIRANVKDVFESILFGIILTILVVFLFLGSFRSTLITGFAIPVSLIGGVLFLYLAGISINIMSLLAFSLAVGLLIDDAIVVRENIFRHIEMGKSSIQAALDGTSEVGLAVIAVTLAVLAVFGPIAFLSGVVGQFFKAFGAGVCFVMIVSLFDALSNAPMLSAYFGGKHEHLANYGLTWGHPVRSVLVIFDRLQTKLENGYVKLLELVLKFPLRTLGITSVVVLMLAYSVKFIPKTFIPPDDAGEFSIALELTPGATLTEMNKVAEEVDELVRKHPDVERSVLTVGNSNGQSYTASFYVVLKPFGQRHEKTTAVKAQFREQLKPFAFAKPKVKEVDFIGIGQRPFVINIRGQDIDQARKVATQLFDRLKNHPGLIDPEMSDKPGLPEYQVKVDSNKALSYGASPVMVGQELRAAIEGFTPVKFRENGLEYDVRVRLQEDQRDLEKIYSSSWVPNMNYRLVRLSDISTIKKEIGMASINRENRGRFISIEADITPGGVGMGGVMSDISHYFDSGEIQVPEGVTYRYVGQAENFKDLGTSMLMAGVLGLVFIYLVLASLYESLVTPFTIMTVIPFAIFGGFFGLFVTGASLDLFSMIGSIMLMGLATKNSIILVDYIKQKMDEGLPVNESIIAAGRTRLRPILMTSFALIAGMLPVAIGLNEASSQRTSLGIAVIGGVFVSTLLTLLVIPAVFNYIERLRLFMLKNVGSKLVTKD